MWRTGLVAPRHVGSSRNRARTCVSCIGRRLLNHCTTREALIYIYYIYILYIIYIYFIYIYIYIKYIYIYIFFFFWLCWVFISVRGLSLVAASGGHSSSRCAGLSLLRPLLLRSTGSRRAGSVAVAHGPSCSAACGIFPDQSSNPCALHWQADSQPLCHQGSPYIFNIFRFSLHDLLSFLEFSDLLNDFILIFIH